MFAESTYIDGFIKYWSGMFGNAESVLLVAVGVGLACILLIAFTGKWRK